jgi:hypothetical protein
MTVEARTIPAHTGTQQRGERRSGGHRWPTRFLVIIVRSRPGAAR